MGKPTKTSVTTLVWVARDSEHAGGYYRLFRKNPKLEPCYGRSSSIWRSESLVRHFCPEMFESMTGLTLKYGTKKKLLMTVAFEELKPVRKSQAKSKARKLSK